MSLDSTRPADTLTDAQLRATAVPVSGPLTDAQLRATAVPVSGTVATGGLTDAQLRATAVPVSNASLPLPSGASTEATLALIKAKTDNIDVLVSTRTKPADQQHVIVDSSSSVAVTGALTDTELRATAVPVSAATLPLPAGASTAAKQPALGTAGAASADVLSVQGVASMTALKVDGSAVTQPVSGTFFQATQPVSGTVTANATLAAETTKVIGTVNLSAGQTVAAVTAITNALPAGTNNIGDVDVLTLPALPTGTNVIGALTANQSVNNAQIAGVATATGNGVVGTGVQRVAIASDNTAFPVTATMGAETTKVIGTTRNADGLGTLLNAAGSGFLKVTDEPRQLFYDPFDAAPDTTNVWTNTSAGGGVAASVTTGVLSLGTGTTANGYSKVVSIPTFKPVIPGWLVFSDAIALPDGAAPLINSYRFWGAGTTPVTPTVAAPITDGYGFELNTDQKLRAVVYAGGVRTVIADLSSSGTGTQPLNATYHRYVIQLRTDRTFFYIDTIDSAGAVASTSFQSPQIQTLPKLYLAIANTPTAPVSNTQIQSSGAVVSDTGKNETQLSDGTFPWRKASVSSTGALSVVQSTLPALSAGTNNIGSVLPATLVVTAVSAANATVTATLPAVASQFHYISRIIIERAATAAIAGSAILTYTSTNLPGSWARSAGNSLPAGGTQRDVDDNLGAELRSSVVNTATTIVAPAAGATGVVRITVYYRTAA